MTWHDITLHYKQLIALQYITLHYITLHYITLHYITLHYITLQTIKCITIHSIPLHYITLHDMTWHYMTSWHYITWHYITSHHITSHHIPSHSIPFHSIPIHSIPLQTINYITLQTGLCHSLGQGSGALYFWPALCTLWWTDLFQSTSIGVIHSLYFLCVLCVHVCLCACMCVSVYVYALFGQSCTWPDKQPCELRNKRVFSIELYKNTLTNTAGCNEIKMPQPVSTAATMKQKCPNLWAPQVAIT